VLLENQSDHSGVLVRISGTEHSTATRSTGYFSFRDVPDGTWNIEAEYPYFESQNLEVEVAGGLQQSPARLVLQQELQFWFGSVDTAISLSGLEPINSELVLDGYVQNISDSNVGVLSISGCSLMLFAIRGASASMTDECEARHGWLAPGDCMPVYSYCFEPGETRRFVAGAALYRECFEPGSYEVFWSLNDNGNHAEHFQWDSDLNKSLIAKRELLRPMTIELVK
jgi:hypothetical protein